MTDNIADQEMTDYLERFEKLKSLNGKLSELQAKLKTAPHDQARVSTLVSISAVQAQLNAELYSQLVTMNNIFGKAE